MRVRIIGRGRAGKALSQALRERGAAVEGPYASRESCWPMAQGCDVVVVAVSDDAIAHVAQSIAINEECVVMHLAGSRGLDVLAPHPKVASLHPLVSLTDVETASTRLLSGTSFATAGDAMAGELVLLLGGREIVVEEADRVRYHATACIAANHLVALTGQVESLALSIGLSLDDFEPLMRAALDDALSASPRHALTGPVSRGDEETLRRHLSALDDRDHESYRALSALAQRLVTEDMLAVDAELSDQAKSGQLCKY